MRVLVLHGRIQLMNKKPSLAVTARRILKIVNRKKYSYRHIQIILEAELGVKPALSFIWKVANIKKVRNPKHDRYRNKRTT